MTAPKGFWHEASGIPTSEAIALEAWAREAHSILWRAAGEYHAVVAESELAEALQTATGIRTSRQHGRWLDKVLAPVAHLCRRGQEPALTSLVVDDVLGWVGERYDEVLRAAELRPITDPEAREKHAALARLECYRWAGSAPVDGGEPAPVAVAARRRATAPATAQPTPRKQPAAKPAPKQAARKRIAMTDRPVTICPTCSMALPATGVCDNCA